MMHQGCGSARYMCLQLSTNMVAQSGVWLSLGCILKQVLRGSCKTGRGVHTVSILRGSDRTAHILQPYGGDADMECLIERWTALGGGSTAWQPTPSPSPTSLFR